MDNVRFGDGDGYIAVHVRGTVILEVKRGPIEVHEFLRREGLAPSGRQRRRWEIEIPVLDSLGDEQMLVGVLMGNDGCPFRIYPFIAVRVGS